MATEIKMSIEFLSDTGRSEAFVDSVQHERESSDDGKQNLAREMFAELQAHVNLANCHNALPKVENLLEQSGYRRTDPKGFIDIVNIPNMWLEISNTFLELRYVLAQAAAYKELEPPNTSPTSDALCAYLHFEKMYKLNLAVIDLMKIQDLVVRLLHECFSGKLIVVDHDDEDWEKKLTLFEAKKGLRKLAENGEIDRKEYDAILEALEHMTKSPHQKTVVNYRNALAHRVRAAVDYPELYTAMQSRAGKVIKNAAGKETGRMYSFGGGRPVDFLFSDLYEAISDYMKHVVEMLRKLKEIPRLS
jgi:hypothetical protein